jgi:hypothetical protein
VPDTMSDDHHPLMDEFAELTFQRRAAQPGSRQPRWSCRGAGSSAREARTLRAATPAPRG